MKLQRSTGILLGVAIALVTTVALFETQKGPQSDQGETLYDFAEADVSAFTLEKPEETLAFTKTDNIWRMTEPEDAAADPSSVAFLLNIITNDTIQETITTTPDQLETYGLDDPTATIQLTVDEATYTLSLGDEDFSGTSLYAITHQEAVTTNSVDVYLIPKGIENGIERPIADWLADVEDPDSTNGELPPQTTTPSAAPDKNDTNDSSDSPTENTEP
ncbi:hypothetical protein N836_06035 [Leptolyngbya sp. Heron Island J]|uniref:DUF4340 domain-containing protein n=1 Tax=Leptolyngbya sp. Heron Island J TaxID=1385935 RepID=UPI0003B98510|nr:DUF4340 domain-containing protein [Leptolyngbya sp. Heron Island J]ESA36796.1 hypothetical protein N836_06035 [Leptolyngbya sp. Heron Island J]